MKYSNLLTACCTVLCGCSTVSESYSNRLHLRISVGVERPDEVTAFRIYVDGRLIGNYTPEDCAIELPVGIHTIAVELPVAYQHREVRNGEVEVRTFSFKGKERVRVLKGASEQTLLFNDQNLKRREVFVTGGH